MLGLMKFKKLFWKKYDEYDKLDELDHEFIAGFTKNEIIRMIQNMSDEELDKAFADISAFTDCSKQSIILLDENKKEIPLQKNVHMMCEKLAEGCGNIVLTFDAQVEERETAHNVQWTLVMRGPK